MIYVDTSVLAAHYYPERISARAQRVLHEQGELAISSLTEVGSANFVLFDVCGLSIGIDRQAAEFPKAGNSALPIVRVIRAQPLSVAAPAQEEA